MTNQIDKAKVLMEKGCKARENLELDKAKKLLSEAQDLFETNDDWYNVTECLNHLAYTEKLIAKNSLAKGLDYVNKATIISEEKKTKQASVYRALISLLDAQSNYEEAIYIAEKLLSETTKSVNKADILSHIALFNLRTGNILQAEINIREADRLLDEGWQEEKDPARLVWKCKVLITASLIEYNKGNTELSLALAEQALLIAKDNTLKTREEDATKMINLINKHENI